MLELARGELLCAGSDARKVVSDEILDSLH